MKHLSYSFIKVIKESEQEDHDECDREFVSVADVGEQQTSSSYHLCVRVVR